MIENKNYSQDFDDVFRAELEHIGISIKQDDERLDARDLKGLAFSGGGIRSASFALGFMQALVSGNKLAAFDYLSTVSGGGYIGSSLTWFLSKRIPPWMCSKDPESRKNNQEQYFLTNPDQFPFGKKAEGNRNNDPKHRSNAILDYIRQHGNYLTPGAGLNNVALIAVILRSLIVSLAVYTALLTSIMVAFYDWGLYDPIPGDLVPINNLSFYLNLLISNWFFALAACLFLIFLLGCLSYSLFTFINLDNAGWKYRMRTFFQRQSGWLLSLALGLTALGSVRGVHLWIGRFGEHFQLSAAGVSTLLAVIGALAEFKKIAREASKVNIWVLLLASLLLSYGIVFMSYYFAELIVLNHQPLWWATIAMILFMVVISIFVNINLFGVHSMYRDRLMETFLPDLKTIRENDWNLALAADTEMLQEMCQHNRRPYHLINTNIVLSDSQNTRFRGRGGDSFFLAPLFCGSDATGWRSTSDYRLSPGEKGISLATAMAISGAAVNPNTGVAGRGLMRNRCISTLLAVLNLRLGFWSSNPHPDKALRLPPNFLSPGLKGGVLGGGLTESRRAIQLSDGGHFENLGLYELIRRKMAVIVVSDAGADPKFNFASLGNAVEKIRVDFGAKVEFDVSGFGLDGLLPGSEKNDPVVRKHRGSRRSFAVASIYYTDNTKGLLIYVKPTFIAGLPADILGYKTAHHSFPNESTLDQFFDEQQFEAYRELGYHIGKQLVDENKDHQWF